MKCLVKLVTLACLVGSLSALVMRPHSDAKYGDKTYLRQQENLGKMLKYLSQPAWNAEMYVFGAQYKIEEDFDSYNNVDEVKEFVDMFNRGMLENNAVFNLYNPDHLMQVKAVFKVLTNAKTYDTAMKCHAWLRTTINENMLTYVIGLCISHFENYKFLTMPPMYELSPYQFVNSEVIKTAHRYKMRGFYGVAEVDGVKEVTIPVNYTGWYMHMNRDQKASYFTEDLALNALYYNYNYDYPHWMEGKPYGLDKDRRGEMYIFYHHSMCARYNLERLSNNLGPVSKFNWREPFKTGYVPHLMYVNGEELPSRPNYYNLYEQGNHKFVQEAEDRERRIRDIIDKGFIEFNGKIVNISRPEDVNTLGTLLQGNPDGFDLHHNFHDHIVPSFLENYATAARDPMFYSFYQRLLANFWKFMSHVEPYTVDEIGFPGVEIIDSHVDKIETFFEHFDVDITNALYKKNDPNVENLNEVALDDIKFKSDKYYIKARTLRLNHKPFNYKLTVKSDGSKEATIRVFIGPKYDEYGSRIDFEENRKNFVLLDAFKQTLTTGENKINRSSDDDNFLYGKSTASFNELYKILMQSKKNGVEYPRFLHEGRCHFPKHLKVPRGNKGGMTYQFYFIVSPYQEPKVPMGSTFDATVSCGVGSGSRYFEDRPLLFPIDREIDASYFYSPNMQFEDVKIFFKSNENIF